MDIINEIEKIRKDTGLTAKEFSTLAGMHYTTYSRLVHKHIDFDKIEVGMLKRIVAVNPRKFKKVMNIFLLNLSTNGNYDTNLVT